MNDRTIAFVKFLQSLFRLLLLSFFLLTACTHPLAPEEDQQLESKRNNPNIQFKDPVSGKTETNIWRGLHRGFQLDDCSDHPEVTTQITWYMAHPNFLMLSASRGDPFIYYISRQIKERHLPEELALLPIVESAYNPYAYSRSGAAGVWQFLPATAVSYSIQESWWYDGRRDVLASTKAALDYLTYLHQYFNGDWLLAIAAYNDGEGRVQAAIDHNAALNLSTDFWSLPLRPETRSYVPKLLALACILSHQKKYPIDWPNTAERVYLASVHMNAQIDLTMAARQADLNMTQFYQLNPGFNRSASDPYSGSDIVLPVDKVEKFKIAMASQLAEDPVHDETYIVKKHDTLNKLALFFHTTLNTLREHNHLSSDILSLNQKLIVPMGETFIQAEETSRNYLMKEREKVFPLKKSHE